MESDEDSVRESLLKSKSESREQKQGKMSSSLIVNEKDKNGKKDDREVEEGDLRLHDAVYDPDNIEEIETLVSEEPKLCFERDSEGHTPLITLTLAGDVQAPEIAKILLGVNESEEDSSLISIDRPELLNLQDARNSTALHYAARGRQAELVSALLKWGADPKVQDEDGNTPLHLVAEGNTENAVEVARILLTNDTKKSLIKSWNNAELTPLHMAIGKKGVNMVNFLLKPENKCDLSLKNAFGRTVLHYACHDTGESESSLEIVKSILKSCSTEKINQADIRGRTALHLSAMKRFPKITKILVDDERTDILKIDEKSKTALHYAAEAGCYTKGYQCVEALISRHFPKYADQVNYLFKMEDHLQNTAFMYASVNCPAETMKLYTGLCPKPQNWLSSMYMTLLYKNAPLSLKPLMDNAFSEDQNETHEGEDGIKTDFGVITGYVDPVDVMPQQETKYLKQALWWNYDAQREILLHPVVQLFVIKKWQKLKWIIASWIFWQLIWLVAYTTVGLTFYTGIGSESASNTTNNESGNTNSEMQIATLLAAFVMLVYLIGSVVNESFEMFTIGAAYTLSLTNILQVVQCAFGCIVIYPVFARYDQPEFWMKIITAAGVLLAYILSMRDIGKLHSKIGLIVEVLKQVLIQIMQVLVCCSPLWIGFTIAFIIIFDDEESLNSSFPGPIVKVLVMMTGEFEYNETFNMDTLGDWTKIIRLMFFLAFLISVPVGFFNLLTGFALDKVMELRERAKVARVAKQLEHIYFIESILLSLRPLRKIFSHAAVVSFFRRLNVTSAWFNTEAGSELKFETFITETIRKPERSFKQNSSGFRNKLCNNTFKYCQPGLSPDIIEEIYTLASPSTS